MIAVDTNILVYAHRAESQWHQPAASAVRRLAEGRLPWLIPWPCIHEFLAVTTGTRLLKPASPLQSALNQVEIWRRSPTLVIDGEAEAHWSGLRKIVELAKVTGRGIHDARIAAICLDHGVSALWTADRDFSRFPALKTFNPLVAP